MKLPSDFGGLFHRLKSISPVNLTLLILILILAIKRYPVIKEAYLLQGQKIESLHFTTLSGDKKVWPQDIAVPTIFVFWATWCEPCKVELHRYNQAILDKEIPINAFYAVNLGEDLQTIQKSIKEHNYQFQVLLDPTEESSRYFKVYATPTVIHINKDKTIDWVASGISPTAIFRAKALFQNKSLGYQTSDENSAQ